MRFKVSKVPTLGECVLLHNVAVSMAYADANTSRGFIELVFKRALVRYLKMLVEAARSGNLEITDIDGVRGTMAQIISRAQASASFLRSENPNAAEALVAFTFLPMLNKWGEPFGFSFEFSGRHIHARIMEEGTVNIFSDNPLSPLTFESKIVTSLNETLNEEVTNSGWLTKDPRDEEPKGFQPWYTAARFFARDLVKSDSSLLRKREQLVKKVALSLKDVGIMKRGGKLALGTPTIKKALSNLKFD